MFFFAISHRARTEEKEGLIGLGLLAVARNSKGQLEVDCRVSSLSACEEFLDHSVCRYSDTSAVHSKRQRNSGFCVRYFGPLFHLQANDVLKPLSLPAGMVPYRFNI